MPRARVCSRRMRRYTGGMKLLRTLALGLACMGPALALAQWQWVDKDGRKVFSDRPPPNDIPAKSILKQPGVKAAPVQQAQAAVAAASAASAPASAPARPAASAPRIAGRDPALEDKKRQAEAAELAKRKADEDKLAALRAENCTRAKRSKASYDSGVRIAQVNEKGEREFLSDEARAAETKRLQGIIDTDCKGP